MRGGGSRGEGGGGGGHIVRESAVVNRSAREGGR